MPFSFKCGKPSSSLIVVTNTFVRIDVGSLRRPRTKQSDLIVIRNCANWFSSASWEKSRAKSFCVASVVEKWNHGTVLQICLSHIERQTFTTVIWAKEFVILRWMNINCFRWSLGKNLGGRYVLVWPDRDRFDLHHREVPGAASIALPVESRW